MQNPIVTINGVKPDKGVNYLRYTTGNDFYYLLCFYAITNDIIDKYKINIHNKVYNFGEYFISFRNFPEFVNRIIFVLSHEAKIAGDLVTYKDYSTYSGL